MPRKGIYYNSVKLLLVLSTFAHKRYVQKLTKLRELLLTTEQIVFVRT